MMRVRTAVEPTPAASLTTAEDVKLEVRISPPKSAPRDFFCEGPIDLKVAVITRRTVYRSRFSYAYRRELVEIDSRAVIWMIEKMALQ